MTEGVENIHQALLDYHYQYDILRSLDDLESYQLIVLADQAALSDAEIDRLRSYVAGGGKLLASGYSSLWDENGRRRDDFGLADLFGVSFRRDPGLPYVSIRLRDQALADRITSFPMFADDSPPVEVSLNGATALGDLVYPETNRTSGTTVMWGNAPPDEDQAHPGLCRNKYGEGVCWYAAWPLRTGGLSNVWIKRLIKELVSDVVTQPVLKTTAPAGVEVVLNRQDGRHVVHLVNHHVGSPDRPSFDEGKWAGTGQPGDATGSDTAGAGKRAARLRASAERPLLPGRWKLPGRAGSTTAGALTDYCRVISERLGIGPPLPAAFWPAD